MTSINMRKSEAHMNECSVLRRTLLHHISIKSLSFVAVYQHMKSIAKCFIILEEVGSREKWQLGSAKLFPPKRVLARKY